MVAKEKEEYCTAERRMLFWSDRLIWSISVSSVQEVEFSIKGCQCRL